MSNRDKNSIYKVGIIIAAIVLLTWLKGIIHFINLPIHITKFTAIFFPFIISLLALALFIKLWVFIYKLNKTARIPEERYRSLYHQAQMGLITTSFDGCKIIMANPKMLEILGFNDFNEVEKLSAYNLWANPNDRLKFISELQVHKKLSAYNFPAVCKDGTIKYLQLYAILDIKSGHIEANIIDVTDKQTYEKQLLYQATLLKNIQESILVIDPQGVIQFYNRQAEQIFKINGNRLINEVISGLGDVHDPYITSGVLAHVTAGHSWQGEHGMMVQGQKRIFISRVDPIINDNLISAYVIMSTDITELVRNREQAEAANLAKSQFLANMSHEIRTPMIGILGAVDLLEQGLTDSKQLTNINIIKECGEQLLKIINEILDVSKIEIGLVNLRPQNCNIYDLFYHTIQIVEPMLKEKGLKLELDLHSISSIEAFLDPYKVRQILTNILFNAIKFTSKGTIKLKSHINYGETRNQLVVSIIDTGIGIPREHIPFIFDPFSQVDNSTSRGFGGTGLGLYICQKLVELMDGTIEVISELGRGTEFIITLPLTISANTLATHETVIKTKNVDDTIQFIPRSVLVVEDNELNQKIVGEMLRNYGFEVSTAINGLECLQILQHKNFDIILLDMQMPLMDGYETAKLIREDININHIPIIAMTAHAMNGDREKCIASGCTSYIAKPFKSEDLVNEIKQHLSSSYSGSKHLSHYNNLFINELIPEFISILADMIEELDEAINSNDMREVKSISHDIKGTAGMYGFNSISHTAAQIEKAAQESSAVKMQNLLKHLHQLFEEASEEVS